MNEAPAPKRRGRIQIDALWATFATLALCAGALITALQTDTTFIYDEWAFLLDRQGLSANDLLDPHNEHIVLAPVLVYRTLIEAFGMDSAVPIQIAGTLIFLAATAALFSYLRRRVDWPVALAFSAIVLYLGSAWSDLLWPFQMGLSGALGCGLGMLLALEREDRRGDLAACVLLIGSLAFSSLGLTFVAAATVVVATSPRPGRLRRSWVPLAPLVLYGLWWLGWGHEADSQASLRNLLEVPDYLFDGLAQALASITGLATSTSERPDLSGGTWRGRVLLIALLPLVLWRVRRVGLSRGLLVALAAAAAYWILSAINDHALRDPTSVRYQYPGAVFVLLIAAELLAGLRVRRRASVGIAVLAVVAIASNIALLEEGAREGLRPPGREVRARLFGLEVARGQVPDDLQVQLDELGFARTTAGDYFAATAAHGSPAFSESELLEQDGHLRGLADSAVAHALGLSLTAPAPGIGPAPSCRTVGDGAIRSAPLAIGPNLVRLARGRAHAALGRFAPESPQVDLGPLTRSFVQLKIPRDGVERPWLISPDGPAAIQICRAIR